jgi:methylated-DNA-[protein]-cysteine S-methyltransferase
MKTARLDAQDVYNLLKKVPEGRVTTYGDLAKALGVPGASRAIGRIMNANPNPLVVPCHRVVSSDGGIGGYAFGVKKKKQILCKEGLEFDGYTIVDFEKRRVGLKEMERKNRQQI